VSRGDAVSGGAEAVWHTVDPCDAAHLRSVFREVAPAAVIHAAAFADIDYCEAHKDEAEQVNVAATRELARLCADTGAKMVFVSTDTVFDGEQGNYREDDPPGPLNWYAETKVRAERYVASEAGRAAVVRTALVMGLPVLGLGNSFLARMVESFDAGREVGVPANEVRTPVDVITLARALLELAGDDFTGLIHIAGNDRLNRFAMVQQIADRLGYDRGLVVAKDPSVLPGRAPRPLDVSLDNGKAGTVLQTPMRGLQDGLELALAAREGGA